MEKPAKFEEIKEFIDKSNTLITFFDNNKSGSLAYVLKRENNLSSPYKVFCKNDDDIKNHLLLHEFGHIYYGHINGELSRKDIIENQLKFVMPELGPNMDEKKFMNIFSTHLDNVTKDMEVNSKVFSKEEFDEFENVLREKFSTDVTLIWPERYDFPIGLNSNTYLLLIMKDIEKFINDDMNNKNSDSNEGGEGEGQPSGGSQSGEDEEKSSGGNKMPSEEELQKYLEDLEERVLEESKKVRTSEDDEEYCEENLRFGENSPWEYNTKGESTIEVGSIKKVLDMSELEEILFRKYKKNVRPVNARDMFYNSNRRKYGSNVIIPKIRQNYKKELSSDAFYILYDVSGSIDGELTKNFFALIKKLSKRFNKKTRVILWNTVCKGDFLITEDIPIISGGGNDLAKGIDYIGSKYKLTSNDYIFLVSDFYDDLQEMSMAFSRLKAKRFGIKWVCEHECNEETTIKLNEAFGKNFEFELVKPSLKC